MAQAYKRCCAGYQKLWYARFLIAFARFLMAIVAAESEGEVILARQAGAGFAGRLAEGFAVALGEIGRGGEACLVGNLAHCLFG